MPLGEPQPAGPGSGMESVRSRRSGPSQLAVTGSNPIGKNFRRQGHRGVLNLRRVLQAPFA